MLTRVMTAGRPTQRKAEPDTARLGPAFIGYRGGWHIRAAQLGGRPGRGRMGATAGPPWRRGPDHSTGTESTAAATA
jgi:hypothetical protein